MAVYLLFRYDQYYPGGGFSDLEHVGNDEAKAVAAYQDLRYADTIELYMIDGERLYKWEHVGPDTTHPWAAYSREPHRWVGIPWGSLA